MLWETIINHPLHGSGDFGTGFTFRRNPFTKKWEWWLLRDHVWQKCWREPGYQDTIVSYHKTWAEPTEN